MHFFFNNLNSNPPHTLVTLWCLIEIKSEHSLQKYCRLLPLLTAIILNSKTIRMNSKVWQQSYFMNCVTIISSIFFHQSHKCVNYNNLTATWKIKTAYVSAWPSHHGFTFGLVNSCFQKLNHGQYMRSTFLLLMQLYAFSLCLVTVVLKYLAYNCSTSVSVSLLQKKVSKFCNLTSISLDARDRKYFTMEGDLCVCSPHITFSLHWALPFYAQVCNYFHTMHLFINNWHQFSVMLVTSYWYSLINCL